MSYWPAPLRLYGLATALAEPFAPLLLRGRVRRGKEDPARLDERLGRTTAARPPGVLVWIHGASVGESLSHLPLVERFVAMRPDLTVLVTSGTRTSAELMAQRLPPGVIHQYAPIDGPRAVDRFIAHWRPNLGVFVESELWPNLLRAAKDTGTRLVLLGARISEDSARRWARSPAAASAVLGLFDVIFTQDSATRDWIEDQGVPVAGRLDLKRLAGPLPCDEAELARMRPILAPWRVVVAASTHAGEEVLVADALAGIEPKPLLVVVPRHPERGPAVAEVLAAKGFTVARRSPDEAIGPDTDVYIADTLGELGLFYRLAQVVVVGGSLVEGLRGHNPLEPARLGRAVIAGPHVEAFEEVYAEMIADKAVLPARGPEDLAAALRSLLAEPALARVLGERARRSAAKGSELFDQAWTRLQRLLPA